MRTRFLTLVIPLVLAGFPAWGENPSGLTPSTLREFQARIRGEAETHAHDKVIRTYDEYVAAQPGRFLPLTVRVLYAQALAKTGRTDAAITVLKEILAEVPVQLDYLRLQYDLANLLLLQGRHDEARRSYERILLRAEEQDDLVVRARERLAKMKQKEGKKQSEIALKLLDVESALDAGQVPEGAKEFLRQAAKDYPETPEAETADGLLKRIAALEDDKARALLNEARTLFDKRKNLHEVREILLTILREYPETSELPSVKILMEETERRLGLTRQ